MHSYIDNVYINSFFYTVYKDFTSQYTNYLSMKLVILVCFVDFLKILSLFTTSMSTWRWYKYTSLFCRRSKCLLNPSHAASVSSEDGWGFGSSVVLSFSSWPWASADFFIFISSTMSSSVNSEQVLRSSSIVVKFWRMSGLSPCSQSLAKGMLSSMSKSSLSSGAGGAGSGCVNLACLKQLEIVDDVTQFQAWLSKLGASSTLMIGVSSLSIALMNFRRTRFL